MIRRRSEKQLKHFCHITNLCQVTNFPKMPLVEKGKLISYKSKIANSSSNLLKNAMK